MPDGWSWKVGGRFWDLRKKAERDWPGETFVRAEAMLSGLYRDVVMRTADGRTVTRRLSF